MEEHTSRHPMETNWEVGEVRALYTANNLSRTGSSSELDRTYRVAIDHYS